MESIVAHYPSNIALVKYWGKKGRQLPCNPSVSLTLTQAYTEVKLRLNPTEKGKLSYFFEGKQNKYFEDRVLRYIKEIPLFSELLDRQNIRIESQNSFPHSTGIASSASAFAAIAAVLLSASEASSEDFQQKGSYYARLGSGSACRSFFGPFASWGKIEGISESSDEFASPLSDIHPHFSTLRDAILIVDDSPKKISSSEGHRLMNNHPYATNRFKQAQNHTIRLMTILKTGDWESFISIVEQEALTLHAMMMTSTRHYLLLKPQTLQLIEDILRFRSKNQLPLCFTLDAGPNVHLLYPASIEKQIKNFINKGLTCSPKSVLYDSAGKGGHLS